MTRIPARKRMEPVMATQTTRAAAKPKDAAKDAKAASKAAAQASGVQMRGAEMVVRALADQGVEHVFGYPGGAVLPIYDALFHQDKVRHILVRHEQGAVHAAEGYA